MKKVFLVLTLVIFGLVSCGKKDSGQKKLRVGLNAVFAPFEYIENGQVTGFDVEMINEIGKNLGYKVEIIDQSFDGLIPALKAGKIDIIVSGMSSTEERKKSVDFSDPYYESGLVALVNKSNSTIKTVKDLEGKRLVVKNGTAGAKFAEDNLKGKATIRVFEDSASTLKAVENNQADAAFEDYPVIAYTIKVNPNLNVKIGTEKLTNNEYGFMVKKGENKELLEKFNKGLKTLKENGEYQKIVDKYTK